MEKAISVTCLFSRCCEILFQISSSVKKKTNGQSSEEKSRLLKEFLNKRIKSQRLSNFCDFWPESHIFVAAECLKLLMWEQKHCRNQKDIFSWSHCYWTCSFSPRILILRVFWLLWMQALSPAVMTLALSIVVYMFGAQRGRGGRMLPRRLLTAGESARCVTRAVWQQPGVKGGCTRVQEKDKNLSWMSLL